MDISFHTTLELVRSEQDGLRFRIGFDSCSSRCLLTYPEVTGLCFTSMLDGQSPPWGTRLLVSAPCDEFVLNPLDRIAFDLAINFEPLTNPGIGSADEGRWTIQLPPGSYEVQHKYSIDHRFVRYDFLGKGSRFADITPPWIGEVLSNKLRVFIPIPKTDTATD